MNRTRTHWRLALLAAVLLALVLAALPAAHAQTSAGSTVVAWSKNNDGQMCQLG